MKRTLHIAFWILLTGGMLVLLGFVSRTQDAKNCDRLLVHIDRSNGMHFISEEDVAMRLKEVNRHPVGMPLAQIDLNGIEKLLLQIPEIETAEVFKQIDGAVGINLTQRLPLVRVINQNGRHFYLDDKGYQMPVSGYYAPRVMVVTGQVNEPFIETSAAEITGDTGFAVQSKLDEIYRLATFIHADPFWKAQVQEIHFSTQGDIELIPMVGSHRIVLGNVDQMEEKFYKLRVFYLKGLKHGDWNRYDRINLKYKKQIVCTKK